MTNVEFINILKKLEKEPTTYYSVAGGDWCKWNGQSWNMDCVCMIKGTLWGFNFNKNHSHGGAIYGSNGVYDDGTEQIINRCSNVSSDFNNIEVGELLWMPGHVGIYIGNREVIECTAAWEGGVLYSKIGSNGERTRNGKQVYSWKKHGKLPYIEYINETIKEEPDYTGTITYQAYTNTWLDEVYKSDDTPNGYAGIYGTPLTAFRCKPQYGEISYEVHTLNGSWIGAVNSNDYSTGNGNSFAGYLGVPIDCVKIKSTKGYVAYRVHTIEDGWLPWVDSRTETGTESYAGIYGQVVDGIQMF